MDQYMYHSLIDVQMTHWLYLGKVLFQSAERFVVLGIISLSGYCKPKIQVFYAYINSRKDNTCELAE